MKHLPLIITTLIYSLLHAYADSRVDFDFSRMMEGQRPCSQVKSNPVQNLYITKNTLFAH